MKKENGSTSNVNVDIFKRGVLILVRSGRWGAHAKMSSEGFVTDEDEKKVVHAIQSLITPEDRELLIDIRKEMEAAKSFVYRKTLPFPIDGFLFIRKETIVEVNDFLIEKQKIIEQKVEIFLEKYSQVKIDFKRRFPKLFNPDLYPARETLKKRFYLNWSFHQIDVPDSSIIPENIWKNEVKKAKTTVEEMMKLATQTIANALISSIGNLNTQAISGEINMKTVNSMGRLVERFESIFKGFVDEASVTEAVKELKKIIKSNPEESREDSTWVEKLAETTGKLLKNLEKVDGVKKRRIKIDK
jgi:hypothetical protein